MAAAELTERALEDRLETEEELLPHSTPPAGQKSGFDVQELTKNPSENMQGPRKLHSDASHKLNRPSPHCPHAPHSGDAHAAALLLLRTLLRDDG